MPRQIPIDGGKFAIFPDDTPDEEMRSALESHTQQQSVWGSLPPIAKALTQAFTPDNTMIPVPSMPKGTFGLSTEAVQGMVGQRQNAQQFNAQQAMQQRVQRERDMEAEKDRAQQLKLEQQRMKNDMLMQKMQMEQQSNLEKERADREANAVQGSPSQGFWRTQGGTPQVLREPQQRMQQFTAQDGQVYNVGEDGTFQPVPGVRGYVPRQGGYGGGGGTEVSWQRDEDAEGYAIQVNPRTGESRYVTSPSGERVRTNNPQDQQPRATPAQQLRERVLLNKYDAAEKMRINAEQMESPEDVARYSSEMAAIEAQLLSLYEGSSAAPANVIGNTEIEIVDDPFVGPPAP